MNKIIAEFTGRETAADEICLCRLGQHSFLLKINGVMIAFDPYLSADGNRLIPPLIAADEFCSMDIICCSHDHGDHLDRPVLAAMAAASPRAVFVLPRAIQKTVTEIPADRIWGMNDGETKSFHGITIRAVAAAHEFLDRGADGLYPYLGFVVSAPFCSVYHSGDCCVYDGLLGKVSDPAPDLMLLPINGRDAVRLRNNCIGNMTWQEAADLAGWSGTRMVIPAHYDMFDGNLADPSGFLDYVSVKYPEMQSRLLAPGEVVCLKLR
ncbi:MAG: MBL fold metallo-hydrolase [Lentisphaerae bacterium]|nr:MBL fold metallo-hydrolase [Lentisphaerota bacterium]